MELDGTVPMMLDGAGSFVPEAPLAAYGQFSSFAQHASHPPYHMMQQHCMVTMQQPGCCGVAPFDATGYCDSSQRSAASAGGGGRCDHHPTSPDSASVLEGGAATFMMQKQQQQQQQYPYAAGQPYNQYAAHSDAELEEMRAQIAKQMQMREQLLQRTQQLSAEVQRREQPHTEDQRVSAIAAARQLKSLLSSLPPDQRRAYATELMRKRQHLLAAGASGAGATDVAAAALEHCQMLMAGKRQPLLTASFDAAAATTAASAPGLLPQLSTRVSHDADVDLWDATHARGASDDDGDALLLPVLGDAAATGECGVSSNSLGAAAFGGAADGDTAASEVQRVVRDMITGTVVALGGGGAASPNTFFDPRQGTTLLAPEDRCSPNVIRPGSRAHHAAASSKPAPAGFSGSSCGSPPYGSPNYSDAAAGAAPCPNMDEDAVKGLLMGDELDCGLLDNFLDDFLMGEDDAAVLAVSAAVATGASVAAALEVQLMGSKPEARGPAPPLHSSRISSSSAYGPGSVLSPQVVQQQPAVRAPSFSSWAAGGGAAAAPHGVVAIGDQHQHHQQQPPLAGGLSQYGMHPAHLEAAHNHPGARAQHGWGAQCSAHAVRSSAPGNLLQATPFARAENQPSVCIGALAV